MVRVLVLVSRLGVLEGLVGSVDGGLGVVTD